MKVKNQVCNPQLAKKLYELKVLQISFFDWNCGETEEDAELIWPGSRPKDTDKKPLQNLYSAFTVAELGEMLPWRSKKMDTINNAELVCLKLWCADGVKYKVVYWDEEKELYPDTVADSGFCDTEADARAKMLIYLLENNLITL